MKQVYIAKDPPDAHLLEKSRMTKNPDTGKTSAFSTAPTSLFYSKKNPLRIADGFCTLIKAEVWAGRWIVHTGNCAFMGGLR